MAVQITMPKLGLTMKDGTVVKWLVSEAGRVREKEPLLEIETEKLSYQVESPASGVLLKKLASEGEKYPVSAVLGYVGQPGEVLSDAPAVASSVPSALVMQSASVAPSAPSALSAPDRRGRVFISPIAKKLASELGLDYKIIPGTGPNGRIVKADVLSYNDACAAASADTVIPYTGIRRAIGENLLGAWKTIPMVTHHVRADVHALTQYRAMLNAGVADKSERVSIGELIIKLCAAALCAWPVMNASFAGDKIILHSGIHLGMATALDKGLVAPVIRDANRKSLLDISREVKELASRARSGTLGPDELRGATFTITNLGAYGSVDFFTPIINPPQAAILGVGRVTDMAVPVDGAVIIRPMMGLSLTYDHRVIDGAVAAGFMRDFMRFLENPTRAVL